MAGYEDFADCVASNQDKADPEAYCGEIMHRVERAKIYVHDASQAPAGVQLTQGPRGGLWFDSSQVPAAAKRPKSPAPKKGPKGKAPKAPKAEKAPPHKTGEPYGGIDDPNLPANVKRENPEVRQAWVDAFNKTLQGGGSEADALAEAKQQIPNRSGKPPAPVKQPKRTVGQQFAGSDDPNVPKRIQQESPDVKAAWVKTFNDTLAHSGSEADAIHAANLLLPRRTTPKADTQPKSKIPRSPKANTSVLEARKEVTPMMPDQPTRAMICLYPDPIIAESLALLPSIEAATSGVELEAPEDLHITLAYYPAVLPKERDMIIQRAAQLASYNGPVVTRVEGVAQFFPGDGDPVPHVLLVDPTGLTALHDSLCYYSPYEGPQASRSHGYIPHITLAYVPESVEVSANPIQVPPLLFSQVSVVFDNEERHDFTFAGGMDATAYREFVTKTTPKIDNTDETSDSSASPQSVATPQQPSEDMDTNEQDDAEKAGKRMRGSMRDKLSEIVDSLRSMMGWATYEDEEEADDVKSLADLAYLDGSSFAVFKDKATGIDRWLSFSSNGFKDREKEIVATDALEKVVAKADESGARGELRLWHTPQAAIGDCDFQAIQGRFLIESGTFKDTELARRAKAYFAKADERLGTSIGFQHPLDAFDGEVYREVTRIVERSVLPHSFAANPWTSFISLKDVPVDANKSQWLEKVAGKDLATEIIRQADDATKALEGSVTFKENTELTAALETVKSVVETGTPEQQAAYAELIKSIAVVEEPEVEVKLEGEQVPAFDEAAFLTKIGELIKPVADASAAAAESAKATSEEVKAIAERVKTIEDETTAQKERNGNAPRAAGMFRASADSPSEDPEAVKGLPGIESQTAVSAGMAAAAPYVGDLVGRRS